MYFLIQMERRWVTCKLHILVVNTKILGVPNLFEKVLDLAWLKTSINW